MTTFDLYYSYSQISVFLPSLNQPFNDWSERHVKQGFAWRNHSVSFRMLQEEGLCKLSIIVDSEFKPNTSAIRAFAVPFEIDNNEVEIGSITDSRCFDVPSGQYALYVEVGMTNEGQEWASVTFVSQARIEPQILIVDSDLSPEYPLDMSAGPA